MKTLIFTLVLGLMLSFLFVGGYTCTGNEEIQKTETIEANIWITEDGEKHFTCPVMGGEGIVDSNTVFTELDSKRYYLCCAACFEKLKANPSKYLEKFVVPGNIIKVDTDGKHFRCPISGKVEVVTEQTPYSDFDGKRYYF